MAEKKNLGQILNTADPILMYNFSIPAMLLWPSGLKLQRPEISRVFLKISLYFLLSLDFTSDQLDNDIQFKFGKITIKALIFSLKIISIKNVI